MFERHGLVRASRRHGPIDRVTERDGDNVTNRDVRDANRDGKRDAFVYCIPTPDGWLRLPEDIYRAHLDTHEQRHEDEPWLDVQELADALGGQYPATWLGRKGRLGEIPSRKHGKYRRYRLNEVQRALEGMNE